MFQIDEERNSGYDCRKWILIFRQFDVNHDGYIPTHEMKKYVRESAAMLGLRPSEAKKLLENADINRDHLIDFPEFCLMMSKAKKMHMRKVMFLAAKMVIPKGLREEQFSYLQQYNCFPPPLFMLFISIIQIAIYIYFVYENDDWKELPIQTRKKVALSSSLLIFCPQKTHELWRYLTYIFIHVDIMHLFFNILTQMILGIALELVHKLWRISAVYFSGVLAGSLFVSIVDPTVCLAGASGGVYALLAAHISELLVNWSEMEYAAFRAFCLGILITVDFASSAYRRYVENEANRISYAAHLSGFLAGILMGVIVLRNFRRKEWEAVMWWICVAAISFLTAVLIVMNIGPQIF